MYQINALLTVNDHFQSFSHVEVNVLTAFADAFVLDLQNLAACLVLDHKSGGNIDNHELTTCTWLEMLYFSVLWILKNNNLVEQLRLWWPWQRQCQNITGNIILNKNAYMWSSFRSDFLFCEISNLYLLSQIAHRCSTVPMTKPGGELTWRLWMWSCISQI